jgi:hypothetical protein
VFGESCATATNTQSIKDNTMNNQHEKFIDYAVRENLKRFVMAFPEFKHLPEEQAAWCMAIDSLMDESINLKERIRHLEYAMNAAIRYINSHQAYEKDAKGMLERALGGYPIAGNPDEQP